MKFCETIKLTPADIEDISNRNQQIMENPGTHGNHFISNFTTKLPRFT